MLVRGSGVLVEGVAGQGQAHRPAVPADDTDRRVFPPGLCELGLGNGLDRGEPVDLAPLVVQPGPQGLEHGVAALQLGERGHRVRRGLVGGLGVLVAVFTRGGGRRGLAALLVRAAAQPAPGGVVAGGFGVTVVAGGLLGACLDQAVPFDIVLGHVVAAGAEHHEWGGHRRSPIGVAVVRLAG